MEERKKSLIGDLPLTFTLVEKTAIPRRTPGKYDDLAIQLEQNPGKAAAIPVSSDEVAASLRSTLGSGLKRGLEYPEHYRVRTQRAEGLLYVWLEEVREEKEETTLSPVVAISQPDNTVKYERKLDWKKYPARTATSEVGLCVFCQRQIKSTDSYYDGGYTGRRAHTDCVSQDITWKKAAVGTE